MVDLNQEDRMPAKQDKTPASVGIESLGAMVNSAVQAQERALTVSREFSENVLGTVKEQAANYSSLLRSVDASLRSMEQAVSSQAASTKALLDSLEASREVVSTAMVAQQQGLERVETFIASMLGVLGSQLNALRAQVDTGKKMMSDPAAAQSDVFLKVTQDWMSAYDQILKVATAPFQQGDRKE
jgi:hypothetical protein